MARINISRFAARQGATLHCDKCRREIAKGEQYRHFKVGFRYGRKQVRCMRAECAPRQSEMTNTKMSGEYAAVEAAEDAPAVADVYREANDASPTGYVFGEDLNERADEISDAASTLEGFDPSEDEPDYESCDNICHDEDDEEEEDEERWDEDAEEEEWEEDQANHKATR